MWSDRLLAMLTSTWSLGWQILIKCQHLRTGASLPIYRESPLREQSCTENLVGFGYFWLTSILPPSLFAISYCFVHRQHVGLFIDLTWLDACLMCLEICRCSYKLHGWRLCFFERFTVSCFIFRSCCISTFHCTDKWDMYFGACVVVIIPRTRCLVSDDRRNRKVLRCCLITEICRWCNGNVQWWLVPWVL